MCRKGAWQAASDRLLRLLCFSDASGLKRPWVAENPDACHKLVSSSFGLLGLSRQAIG